MVKCENKTVLVHSHCSAIVGIFLGCNFHFLKYGIESMMIQGIDLPKYTIYNNDPRVNYCASSARVTSYSPRATRNSQDR
jgi:hypothetical protein